MRPGIHGRDFMQLTVLADAPECLAVATSGTISRSEMDGADEPLAELLGQDVYSRRILLNLAGSPYMDSSGVSWLLVCHKRCRQAGGRLVVHSYPPIIAQILRVLRMELVLQLAPTETEARRRLECETRP
jgi:anti-sigma B factor antagonist